MYWDDEPPDDDDTSQADENEGSEDDKYGATEDRDYFEREYLSWRDYPLVLKISTPLDSARKFLRTKYTAHGLQTLYQHQGTFYGYDNTCYRALEDPKIRADIYDFLDEAWRFDETGHLVPFSPNKTKVTSVVDALKASPTLITCDQSPPMWINHSPTDSTANELVACKNGLLHLPTGELFAPSPRFFTTNAIEFDYNPNAEKPWRWLQFLSELWGDDDAPKELLQDFMGYLLTPDTSHQKMLLMIGPKRSGKGTIGKVIEQLVGKQSVCNPTLSVPVH